MSQQPRKLRREQQVEVTIGADGVQSVKAVDGPPSPTLTADPCFECACCASWTVMLELVRAHTLAHVARVPALLPCPGECIVCAAAAQEGPLK